MFGFAGMFIGDAGGADSALQTIQAHAVRFRIGLTFEFLMLNSDIVLAVALYGLLRPIDNSLALLGTLWRCANALILAGGVVAAFTALDVLAAHKEFSALSLDQIHGLANQDLQLHDAASSVGLVCWSMGASLHSYLLWRSEYIPRFLSGAYLVVAVIILIAGTGCMISPSLGASIEPWYVFPDVPVELAVAVWLVVKGARIAAPEPQGSMSDRV